MDVIKFCKLDTDKPSAKVLCNLNREAKWFALATRAERFVYLSGGQSTAGTKVSALDTEADTWHDLPDLNHKRHLHASLVHKHRLFVMGGDNGATFVASVEFIDLGGSAAAWTILTEGSNLLKRAIPAATVVNQDEIAVYGGLSKGGTKSDGYVVDSNSESIEPALEGDAGFAFRTYN